MVAESGEFVQKSLFMEAKSIINIFLFFSKCICMRRFNPKADCIEAPSASMFGKR